MTTAQTQAEALQVAELLESWAKLRGHNPAGSHLRAAAELRRLHARVAELEAQAQLVRDALTAEQAATNAAVLADPLTRALYLAWAKAEPRHAVTHYPVSYFESFRDMADAARAHGFTKEKP